MELTLVFRCIVVTSTWLVFIYLTSTLRVKRNIILTSELGLDRDPSVSAVTSRDTVHQAWDRDIFTIPNNTDQLAGNVVKVFDVSGELRDIYTEGGSYALGRSKSIEINACTGAKTVNHILSDSKRNGSFYVADNLAWIYAAYFDDREKQDGCVSIHMTGLAMFNAQLTCSVHWQNGVVEEATVDYIYRLHFEPVKYQNALMSCRLCKSPDGSPPRQVYVSKDGCSEIGTTLPVQDLREKTPQYNFTVCLHKTLYNNYGNVTEFVEWIEVNRLFGADKIAVYNYTGSSVLSKYVDYYAKKGILDIYPWDISGIAKDVPKYMGQGAVIDDCIYKYMYKTKYLILIDFDEVVVPQGDFKTWQDIFADDNNECKVASDVAVRNTFFNTLYEHDTEFKAKYSHTRMNTLAYTKRYNFTHPCVHRSKIIMKPKEFLTAGVHFGLQKTNGRWAEKCCLSTSYARLHHYRFWKRPMSEEWTGEIGGKEEDFNPLWDNVVEDRRMWAFEKELIARSEHFRASLNETLT